jgi:glycosyltransferase involved in cell wall biosynthesis
MRKKKIIFYGEIPPKTVHGASISNFINIQLLIKHFDVEIIEEFSNLKYHNQFSFYKLISFLSSLIKLFKSSISHKSDYFYGVIYLSTFGILKNIISTLIFKIFNSKSKVILHFHRSDFRKFISKKINYILFRILNLFVDEFILLSKRQKTDFPIECNSSILYNTIELEILEQKITNNSNDYILYIGNYIEEKGIFDLILAVKKYNNENNNKLKLICHGNVVNDIFYKLIKEEVKDEDYIILNGPIYNEQKMSLIKNAKFTILPSYNEGVPLTLLESISVGTPMIITNVGYVKEVLGDNYPLYCKAKDINSIISCFNSFEKIDNKLEFKSYLFQIYKNNFSHKFHQDQLLKIFNK